MNAARPIRISRRAVWLIGQFDAVCALSPRRTRAWRARTENMRRLSKQALNEGAIPYPDVADIKRPRTRAECIGHLGPCPWVSCKWHLYLDVNPRNGSIKVNFPDREPWEIPETCALDVADRGPRPTPLLAPIFNLTRQAVDIIRQKALRRLQRGQLQAWRNPD